MTIKYFILFLFLQVKVHVLPQTKIDNLLLKFLYKSYLLYDQKKFAVVLCYGVCPLHLLSVDTKVSATYLSM